MNTLKYLGIAALLGLAGCDKPPPSTPFLGDQYSQPAQPRNALEQTVEMPELTGNIVRVQEGEVSFVKNHGSMDGATSAAANHTFEYVMLQDPAGNVHVLVYPYSLAVLEGRDATIRFRALTSGITSAEFVRTFIAQDLSTLDDFQIETEGLIVKDGIEYN